MSIKRSTLILAGSLLLGSAAFASNQGSKPERIESEQTYAGTQTGTMVPSTSSQVIVPLTHEGRGDLRK